MRYWDKNNETQLKVVEYIV